MSFDTHDMMMIQERYLVLEVALTAYSSVFDQQKLHIGYDVCQMIDPSVLAG